MDENREKFLRTAASAFALMQSIAIRTKTSGVTNLKGTHEGSRPGRAPNRQIGRFDGGRRLHDD